MASIGYGDNGGNSNFTGLSFNYTSSGGGAGGTHKSGCRDGINGGGNGEYAGGTNNLSYNGATIDIGSNYGQHKGGLCYVGAGIYSGGGAGANSDGVSGANVTPGKGGDGRSDFTITGITNAGTPKYWGFCSGGGGIDYSGATGNAAGGTIYTQPNPANNGGNSNWSNSLPLCFGSGGGATWQSGSIPQNGSQGVIAILIGT